MREDSFPKLECARPCAVRAYVLEMGKNESVLETVQKFGRDPVTCGKKMFGEIVEGIQDDLQVLSRIFFEHAGQLPLRRHDIVDVAFQGEN
jgi:hypothetical protein